MFRFLRVNMATKTCVFEDIPEEYAGLGGRALTSTIVAREVNPICTPLGPHNKLVFAPGLLGATNSPNGNRISVGCKSPLTEGIKEANSGGQPGGHLAKLGIMAIIVEDMATEGDGGSWNWARTPPDWCPPPWPASTTSMPWPSWWRPTATSAAM